MESAPRIKCYNGRMCRAEWLYAYLENPAFVSHVIIPEPSYVACMVNEVKKRLADAGQTERLATLPFEEMRALLCGPAVEGQEDMSIRQRTSWRKQKEDGRGSGGPWRIERGVSF